MFKTKAVSRKGADVKGSVGSLCPTEGARYDGFPIESGMTRGGVSLSVAVVVIVLCFFVMGGAVTF